MNKRSKQNPVFYLTYKQYGMRPMNQWQPARILFALVLAIGGSLVAGQLDGMLERTIVVVVTVMLAVFVLVLHDLDPASADVPVQAIPPPDRFPITEHGQFQNLLDASVDPILVVSAARVSAANKAALDLLGENIVGQNVRLAFRHAGAIERLTNAEAKHSGQPIRLSGIGRPSQLWDMRIQSIGADQKLVHLADRSAAQAAEKMRVDFVANASHELLTPLAAVKGFIETLGEPTAGSNQKTRERFLGIMAAETDRMQALIRDLMSLSRIEAEKYAPPQDPVDLAALVTTMVEQLRNAHKERGADLVLEIAPNLPTVPGDVGQLQQVAANLITNAMKYGKAGTPVTIKVEMTRSNAMLALSVADRGDGIAAEHLPRLTERFYRVDSGRSRSVGGTGLGLSLVKHIVDRHRGHLEIRSQTGEGTVVSVLLPVSRDSDAVAG